MSAYNAENHIEEAVQSILDQSFKDFEFIIVNDGSNDRTLGKIRKFTECDKRIRLINQKNIGLTKSLIKMAGVAKGLYIARMDADDISHKERFALQIKYLEDNSSVGMVGSWINIIDSAGTIQSKKKLVRSNKKIKSRIKYGNQFVHGSVMFRKDIYSLAGGYDENFRYSQDYDLWLRMAKISNCVNYPAYLYLLRVHGDSISNENSESQLDFAVNSIMKNVCHQRIKYRALFFRPKCKCPVCSGTVVGSNTDIIKTIVSARLLLRRGEYEKSAYFYSKMNNIEGAIMSLILSSSRVTYFLKKIYVSLIKLVE